MPQLKKVALAMGNLLAYADTYEQALQQLIGLSTGSETANAAQVPEITKPGAVTPGAPRIAVLTQVPINPAEQTLEQVRTHLRRYKDLSAEGKWAEAGKELDEIQRLLQKP
jgi:uncharacterized membrane protein (UPF0182 family)